MPEFRISSLRFNYAGTWSTNTFYNRDAIITFNGQTYVCQVPHTSGIFDTDLNTYSVINGINYAYWLLIIPGRVWEHAWQPNTHYEVNNIVYYHGALYICNTAHTSGASIDTTNFSIYAEFANFSNTWQPNTYYGYGDVVTYGGITYYCIVDHLSASSASLGLEANQSDWKTLDIGVYYSFQWTPNTRYRLNDLVRLDADLYICTQYHTSTNTFDTTKFQIYLPGEIYSGTWSSTIVYQIGDVVQYGGYEYTSLTANNSGHVPSTDSIDWTLLTTGYSPQGEWSPSANYQVGDVVTRHGQLYAAIQDNIAQDPVAYIVTANYTSSTGNQLTVSSTSGITIGMIVSGTGFYSGQTVVKINSSTSITLSAAPDSTPTGSISFIGINYLYWELQVNGVYWRGYWQYSTTYVLGDIVVYKNTTYKAIQNNTSEPNPALSNTSGGNSASSSPRPDQDTTNTYWIIYTLHDRRNVLAQIGDTLYYDNGTAALPIGTESQNLKVTNVNGTLLPTWSTVFVVPNIFYVAPTGTDDSKNGYGLTWDKPFKTISYACNYVAAGLVYPNAASNLKTNKQWMVTEMYNYLVYSLNNNLNGVTNGTWYTTTSGQEKTIRDAEYIIDALAYDSARGGNSQTVAAAEAYFQYFISNQFYDTATAADIQNFIIGLNYLLMLVNDSLTLTVPSTNYQQLNGISAANQITQNIQTITTPETGAQNYIDNLFTLVTTSLITQSTSALPTANSGISVSIYLKTGTYAESLPINVPENVSIIGDELRSTVVEPLLIINTIVTKSHANTNTFTADSTAGLADQTPVQFIAVNNDIYLPLSQFESPAVVPGNTYYVVGSTITNTDFSITSVETFNTTITAANGTTLTVATSTGLQVGGTIIFATPYGTLASNTSYYILSVIGTSITIGTVLNGTAISVGTATNTVSVTVKGAIITLQGGTGIMQLVGGDAIQDMFRVRNGVTLRNMTWVGKLGTLTAANSFGTKRPTGSAYVALDPGLGPNDTSAWIIRRSPYIQNVTVFGNGAAAMKIDGSLHNGGNKSMVCNDFTHIVNDGIGIWCTNSGALVEAISVFSYYGYIGYLAENGGKIRAANGNSSYGTYGLVAEGYDNTEVPIAGNINNQYGQATATVQSSFGTNASLLSVTYQNAGEQYVSETTNLLKYSNNFLGSTWTDTSGIPTSGATLISLQQNFVSPNGNTDAWSVTSPLTTLGINETVSITPTGSTYTGIAGTNISGTGTGATFDILVSPAGYTVTVATPGTGYVVTNQIRILGSQVGGLNTVNDIVLTITALSGSGVSSVSSTGTIPNGVLQPYTFSIYVYQGTSQSVTLEALFGATYISSVTYNFATAQVSVNSSNGGILPSAYGALNENNGWYRIYMTTYDPTALQSFVVFRLYPSSSSNTYTIVYGGQVDLGSNMSFFSHTDNDRYSQYADYIITGAGHGVKIKGAEIRSQSVFQSRTVDQGYGAGGGGYLTASNNAQGGTDQYIILSQADTNTAANYVGLNLFVISGTGAGQYGTISSYNTTNKFAYVLKPSFVPLSIASSSSTTNNFTLTNTSDTSKIFTNMPVQFVPTTYTTTVTAASQSYVTVTSTTGGIINTLTLGTGSTSELYIGQPCTFSGTTFGQIVTNFTYYISAIINSTDFQVATTQYGNSILLVNGTGSMTMNIPSNNNNYTASTANMVSLYPIQFTGNTLGGITDGTVYYINQILNSTTFNISASLVTASITATTTTTDLLTTSSTSSLVPLNPIQFSGTVFGGITAATTYYVSVISSSTQFTISNSIVQGVATATTAVSNTITVDSTSNFIVGNPITFSGINFGGLVGDQIYYISAIPSSTEITVSSSIGGAVVPLTTATGYMTTVTTGTNTTLTTATGTMSATSTSSKLPLRYSVGTMNSTFSTPIFGGISTGTTYYISNIGTGTFQVATTSGSTTPVTLTDAIGTMQIAWVGWDHVNPGTPSVNTLDTTSTYFIEPKLYYSAPSFVQTNSSLTGQINNYSTVGYGNGRWIAMASGNTASTSIDGATWSALELPVSASWSSITYGGGWWVAISSGGATTSTVLYSSSDGTGWKISSLPTASWSKVVYTNGWFVAIAANSTTIAYSNDFGATWTSSTTPTAVSAISAGKGMIVAVDSGSSTAYYVNLDGQNTFPAWQTSTLPTSSTWSDIAFGNGRFIAVSSTSTYPIYTFDGINWYSSPYSIAANYITYGQGLFLAVNTTSNIAYTSEDCIIWTSRSLNTIGSTITAISFGYTNKTASSPYVGQFILIGGTSSSAYIVAGTTAKSRPVIVSGVMSSINTFEPGSGYATAPTLTIFDPNVTTLAVLDIRVGNGVLAGPEFISRGLGYNTNNTTITINGNGYADQYQTGFNVYINNLTKGLRPGDDLTITNNNTIYKVTSFTALNGSVAPYISALVSLSPGLTTADTPSQGTQVQIREAYSQVRATNHDFLSIGFGDQLQSNYPGQPTTTSLQFQNQVLELNYGRVFYSSTDQDGNFAVGNLFGVQQATGIVTLSASQFGLQGLSQLALQGVAIGSSSVVVSQFSTDPTFVANSDSVVPTQRAIASYLQSRLSQGGANATTGQLTAGVVTVGGPNTIGNTVPQGIVNSSLHVKNKMNFESNGGFGQIDGAMIAFDYWMQQSNHKSGKV